MNNNSEKLKVAIIGSGNRTRKVYTPLFDSLKNEMEIVAVCDPNKESCEEYAQSLGERQRAKGAESEATRIRRVCD